MMEFKNMCLVRLLLKKEGWLNIFMPRIFWCVDFGRTIYEKKI